MKEVSDGEEGKRQAQSGKEARAGIDDSAVCYVERLRGNTPRIG